MINKVINVDWLYRNAAKSQLAIGKRLFKLSSSFYIAENNQLNIKIWKSLHYASYVNLNFPAWSYEQDNIGHDVPPQFKTKVILLTKEEKSIIQLFGKIAQEFYPDTPEKIEKVGEPYAYLLLSEPECPFLRITRNPNIRPKWHTLFESDYISREEFFKAIKVLGKDSNTAKVFSEIANNLIKQGINLSGYAFHKVKYRNRSESRSHVNRLFDKDPILREICDFFLSTVLGSSVHKFFTMSDFSYGLSFLNDNAPNGEIDFELFSSIMKL